MKFADLKKTLCDNILVFTDWPGLEDDVRCFLTIKKKSLQNTYLDNQKGPHHVMLYNSPEPLLQLPFLGHRPVLDQIITRKSNDLFGY